MRLTLRLFLTVTSFLFFNLSLFSQQVAKTITYPASPDGVIGFLEFKPANYNNGQKHPLIIFLHGIGERGNGTSQINNVTANAIPKFCAAGASMQFTVGGKTSSFIVLSPQLSLQYGNWQTYYVKEMIKYAKTNLQVDTNRIYLTGLSLGGGGVWRTITETVGANNSFDAGIAAAAPVCGTQEEDDNNFCTTIGANHLPVWAFHSMDDGTVGVGTTQHAQGLANQCSNMNPIPIFTYYQSGGHSGAWDNAYDTGHITRTINVNGNQQSFTANPNLYEWFLSNTRAPAPTISPIAAQTIALPVSNVTLTGIAQAQGGATIASYAWTLLNGPNIPTINSSATATTTVSGLIQGIYKFSLTVTDNNGLYSVATTNVTVNAAGSPEGYIKQSTGPGQACDDPSSAARIPVYGTSVTNGAIIYQNPALTTIYDGGWNWFSFTPILGGAVQYAFAITPTGVIVQLQTCPGWTAANTPPVANAGSDQTITLPTNSVTLSGSGTGTNGATISSYAWVKTSGPSSGTITSSTTANTTVTGLTQGTYVFTLTVTDNHGLTNSDDVTITVNPVPNTGIGYIKRADGPGQACDDASSTGRTTIYTNAIVDGNKVYTDAAHNTIYDGGWNWYSYTTTIGGATTYAFAITPNGDINQSSTCPYHYKPVVTATASSSSVTLPTSFNTLSGSATASGGATISSYVWTQVSGPNTATIVTPSQSSTVVSGLILGSYNFKLTATDNLQKSGEATVSFVVINQGGGTPNGYITQYNSPQEACGGNTSNGIPVFVNAPTDGNIIYTDAAHTSAYNGDWRWFAYSTTAGGTITRAFALTPTGGIIQSGACPWGSGALPPDVDAGNSQQVVLPTNTATLQGTATPKNGATITSYAWTQVSGPNTAVISTPSSASTQVSGMIAGVYIFKLTATDNNGLSNNANTSVEITSTPTPPTGYIKQSVGAYQACADNSSTGRTTVYITNNTIANSNLVYRDGVHSSIYDGGWNWFSFTPTLGGSVTYAFAITPSGAIIQAGTCPYSALRVSGNNEPISNNATLDIDKKVRLSLYPNPVRNTAVIELISADDRAKTINLYNSTGVLKAKYTWQTNKGKNIFPLKNIPGLAAGLYVVDVRDSNGKSVGNLRFIKL